MGEKMNVIKKNSIVSNIKLNNRNLYIDFVRGCAMLLVLLHHCGSPFRNIILLFHMPLFFILSGYTYYLIDNKFYEGNILSYVKNRFKKIIIPYFVFEFINALIYIAIQVFKHNIKAISLSSMLYSIITCINIESYYGITLRLWFFPCIFISSILLFITLKYANTPIKKVLSFVIFLVLSYVTSNLIVVRLPFTIDISMLATAYMLIGFLGGFLIDKYKLNEKVLLDLLIAGLAIVICAILCYFYDSKMLMYENQYGDFFVSILVGLFGSISFIIIINYFYKLMLIILFKYIQYFVIWFSQNSLAIFPVHLQLIYLFSHIEVISKSFFLKFPIITISTIIVVNIINNYFPYLIQKK